MPTTVRIGFQLPEPNVRDVTGFCAAEMAVDAFNQSGQSALRVELAPVIDRRDRATGRAAAEAFVADPLAVAMLGPINSDMALATQDIYHSAGLAQVSSEASSPPLTARGYRNFFRVVANDEVQGRALAAVAVRYLKGERIAVLSDGSGWGRPIAEIVAAEAARLGTPPVLTRFFMERESALDFDDLVDAVVSARPDVVYFAIYWNKAHIIAHRLRDRGVRAVFLGSDALKPYAFLEVPSLDQVAPYHTLAGIDMRLKPSARNFFEAFARRYPMMLVAPQYAAEAFDAAGLLLDALTRAAVPKRGAVLQAMQARTGFSGALGPIEFDAHGDLRDPEIGLYQCKDGLRRYIGTVREVVSP